MASCAARHQSSGSCSAQPMCSEWTGAWSAEWEARTWPARSMRTARVPPVPTSMPRNMGGAPEVAMCRKENSVEAADFYVANI